MQSVGSDYEFGSDLIGHGAFAVVYKGRQISTGQPVAVKQILLKNIPGKLSNMRQKEIAILKDLKHANIVQLFDCYETKVELYLIMEFCNGGDLADYLQDKKTLSEDSIKHLSRHIAAALVFIHRHHIIHRDIKPQNVLLTYQTGTSSKLFKEAIIKIADFGFARYLSEADMAATICGSPIYMAPEILIGHKYDSKVDMWSTGVILYQCLTGSTPFRANDPHSLRKQYIRNPLVPQIPPGTSSLLSDLLLRLIKKSPQERISQDAFKAHSFLQVHSRVQEEDSPSLHAKSSPVPISRPVQVSAHSGYSLSPKTSPHGSRTSYGSLKGFSASSGPPSIQRIVTNSSLGKYYSSPPTNETDEGFVLVGKPGRHQRSSLSSCSTEGSVGSSSRTSPSPHSSLSNYTNLIYSPHPQLQDHSTLTHTGSSNEPNLLSHTPPFSSLFRTGGPQSSIKSSSQRHAIQTTPLSYSPDSSPCLRSPSISSSPGRRSLPSSRSGSHNKLSTLVESHREGSDHMIDSTDMITPSLLLESDVLRDELERLSNPTEPSQGNLFSILKNSPQREEELRIKRSSQQGLNLSQELADIRKRDASLNQKRSALFQVGDSKEDLSPLGERSGGWRAGGVVGNSSHASSPIGSEEMFPFQLEEEGDSSLYQLQQNIALSNELLRIARTRQGPMLLLSSSMGDSGGMLDHVVRFSEQLVLCAKAATVIRDGIRQYNIGNALTSSDPSDTHKTVLSDAERLESHCMDKARIARDLYQKCLAKRRRHSLPSANVTAEKLIFLQAADMCKQALLEEKTNRREECLRKYKLACLLLKLLQSDAKTPTDRNTLQKYISHVQYRQQMLTSSHLN